MPLAVADRPDQPARVREGFWRRRVISPLRTQLTLGATPPELSRSLAAGVLCGIFPVLGTTTLLATLAGAAFRLNQVVMQSVNWVVTPVQVALIPVFIRAGESMFGAEPIPFSIPAMLEIFLESPGGFFANFRMTFVHCIAAWLLAAPLLWIIVAASARPLLDRAARRWLGTSFSLRQP